MNRLDDELEIMEITRRVLDYITRLSYDELTVTLEEIG